MSNAIKSQGTTLSWNGTLVGEVNGVQGPGGSASEIDVTHLSSTAKEVIIGLPDEGQVTLDCNLVPDDAGQTALRNDRMTQTLRAVVITLSDTTTISFNAYCMGFSINGAVDQKVAASITLRVSGAVTWA